MMPVTFASSTDACWSYYRNTETRSVLTRIHRQFGIPAIGVAYDRAPRKSGTSSFKFWNLVELAVDGIVSHSILPLRLASLVGIAVSMIAVLTILAYLVLYQESWPAGFATLAVLMLVSLAMNAIFLGIIGEYLARIFKQVKPRPLVLWSAL